MKITLKILASVCVLFALAAFVRPVLRVQKFVIITKSAVTNATAAIATCGPDAPGTTPVTVDLHTLRLLASAAEKWERSRGELQFADDLSACFAMLAAVVLFMLSRDTSLTRRSAKVPEAPSTSAAS